MTYALYTGKSKKYLENGKVYEVLAIIHNDGKNRSVGDDLVLDKIPGTHPLKDFQLFEGYVAFGYISPKVGSRLYLSRVISETSKEVVLERVLTSPVVSVIPQHEGNKYMVITSTMTMYELTLIG